MVLELRQMPEIRCCRSNMNAWTWRAVGRPLKLVRIRHGRSICVHQPTPSRNPRRFFNETGSYNQRTSNSWIWPITRMACVAVYSSLA